jgi:hypothetical protein
LPPVQSIHRVNWVGQEANHLSPSNAKAKGVWRYIYFTSIHIYSPLCGA